MCRRTSIPINLYSVKRQEPCSRSLPEARNLVRILTRQQKSELGKGAKKVGRVSWGGYFACWPAWTASSDGQSWAGWIPLIGWTNLFLLRSVTDYGIYWIFGEERKGENQNASDLHWIRELVSTQAAEWKCLRSPWKALKPRPMCVTSKPGKSPSQKGHKAWMEWIEKEHKCVSSWIEHWTIGHQGYYVLVMFAFLKKKKKNLWIAAGNKEICDRREFELASRR